jgi:hypothetical protein
MGGYMRKIVFEFDQFEIGDRVRAKIDTHTLKQGTIATVKRAGEDIELYAIKDQWIVIELENGTCHEEFADDYELVPE